MKCPKCNFISFDYNQACPKCGHDLSHEMELMNLPAYTPKELSLLGLLTGNGDISSVDALIGPSEIPGTTGEGAEELLISLDSFSDEEQEPIQFEPEPSLAAVEPIIEEGATGADDGLTISLEDLSDEGHEPIQFELEPSLAAVEPIIEEGVTGADDGLTISLEDLSDEERASIQFESEPSLAAVEPIIEEGATGADDGLTISLEDLSDEEHESIFFDSETVAVTPEMEIEDKVADGQETGLSEEREAEKEGFWEPNAIEQRMADMQLEDASKEDGATGVKAEVISAEGKEEASDLLELELEPLELDIEIEETDKKDA